MKTRALVCIAALSTVVLAVTATLLAPEGERSAPGIAPSKPQDLEVERPAIPKAHVVYLDEIGIVAPKPAWRKAQPKPPAPEPRLVPCSGWRALGPVYSAPAGAVPAQRHVRLMCPES